VVCFFPTVSSFVRHKTLEVVLNHDRVNIAGQRNFAQSGHVSPRLKDVFGPGSMSQRQLPPPPFRCRRACRLPMGLVQHPVWCCPSSDASGSGCLMDRTDNASSIPYLMLLGRGQRRELAREGSHRVPAMRIESGATLAIRTRDGACPLPVHDAEKYGEEKSSKRRSGRVFLCVICRASPTVAFSRPEYWDSPSFLASSP
jgi:hypothetical protein